MRDSFHYPDAKFICAVKELEYVKDVLKALDLGPSSLTIYTKRIEDRFGKSLFVRDKKAKTIGLNEEGLEVYSVCKKMLVLAGALGDFEGSSHDLLHGEVKLTGTSTILLHFCLPYLIEFSDMHPKVDVSIKQFDNMMDANLSLNEFYFTTEVQNDGENYAYFPYHNFVQKLWASPEYIEKHGKIRTGQDLYRHTLLFQKDITGGRKSIFFPVQIQSAIYQHDIKTFSVSGTTCVDFLCERGLGIMSGSEETTKLGKLNVVPILDYIEGDIIKVFVKVSHRFIAKKIGKTFLNWIFESRDKTLKGIKITPSKFEPLAL